MNILFLAYNVNIHSRTGDAVHVLELAFNLATLGNKVSLVVGFNPASKEDISSLTNNPNIDLQYVKKPKFKYPRSRDVSILSLCFNIIKNNSFDIIYERNFSCRIGVILSKILRRPLVVEINGLVDEEAEMQGRHASLIRGKIGKRLRRFFFMQASKIVSVTDGIKGELMKSYKIPSEKIDIVYNGANTDLFKPLDQNKAKEKLGFNLKNKYVCFVGNLAPWQGVEYLIQAAPRILKTCPDARFMIIGDGQMKNEWMESTQKLEVSENFVFTGSVPFVQVSLYINVSDVCVAPFVVSRNKKIGLSPLKMYEYMACGKPIVASRISGVSSLLNESGGGITITPESPDELADAVIKLLQNEDLKKQMGTNGREYVVENHSWASVAKKVADVCENVIAQHN